jgi:hypothetical protein
VASVIQKRVPQQFIVKAAKLRDEIRASNSIYQTVSDQILAHFRPKPGFQPYPRRTQIAALSNAWWQLPAFGRLRLMRNLTKGCLRIVEARCIPVNARQPTWDAEEPGLMINLRTITVEPPIFAEQSMTLAVVGVHALARYFQRSFDGTDNGLFNDLAPVGFRYPDIIKEGRTEFHIETESGGTWAGQLVAGPENLILRIQTFLD